MFARADIIQGTVFSVFRKSLEDADLIERCSKLLLHTAEGTLEVATLYQLVLDCLLTNPSAESTFDVLYGLFTDWRKDEDALPILQNSSWKNWIETVLTFDLDHDICRFDKASQSNQIDLDDFRQQAVTPVDFRPYIPRLGHQCNILTYFQPPFWEPQLSAQEESLSIRRTKAVISRLLTDFGRQWRHILLSPFCSEITFQRTTTALIRLVSFEFRVAEIIAPRHGAGGGARIWMHTLPGWSPLSQEIVEIAERKIIICRHMAHAKYLMEEAFCLRASGCERVCYLVISLSGLLLYELHEDERPRYTKPTPLFDDGRTPTSEAIDILAKWFSCDRKSRFDTLPVELQDMILDQIASPIERARIGCILQIGKPFSWTRDDGGAIELCISKANRRWESPMESEMWFEDEFTGLSYK